jgi:hypothetical protein
MPSDDSEDVEGSGAAASADDAQTKRIFTWI